MKNTCKGRLIVIEGLDGCGKATQTGLLYEALKKSGKAVKMVSYPDYQSNSSALVRMYLSGEFGSDPNAVNAYAASTFYAVDRYAGYKKNWGKEYEEGTLVLCDRYTTSNAIHQCSKLPKEDWDEYLDWLFTFEYQTMGIPAPDQVIFLKGDISISQELMTSRYQGDEKKKDIHESNVDYMRKSSESAIYCSEKLNWIIIDCIRDGKMRSPEDIHEEILSKVSGPDKE